MTWDLDSDGMYTCTACGAGPFAPGRACDCSPAGAEPEPEDAPRFDDTAFDGLRAIAGRLLELDDALAARGSRRQRLSADEFRHVEARRKLLVAAAAMLVPIETAEQARQLVAAAAADRAADEPHNRAYRGPDA